MEIMKNWCSKAKMKWGQGIGIGGGGMLASFEGNLKGQGPIKNLWDALNRVAVNVSDHHEEDDIYTVPNFPRAMNALGGNISWRRQIKENGLK